MSPVRLYKTFWGILFGADCQIPRRVFSAYFTKWIVFLALCNAQITHSEHHSIQLSEILSVSATTAENNECSKEDVHTVRKKIQRTQGTKDKDTDYFLREKYLI